MTIYIDARLLQGETGKHGDQQKYIRAILNNIFDFAEQKRTIAALIDPAKPDLEPSDRAFFNRLVPSAAAIRCKRPAFFLYTPDPALGSPKMLAAALGHPLIVSGALLHAWPSLCGERGAMPLASRLERLETLTWVSRSDRIFAIGPSVADGLARNRITFGRRLVAVDDAPSSDDAGSPYGTAAQVIWNALAQAWDERFGGTQPELPRPTRPRLAVVGPCRPTPGEEAARTMVYAAALAKHAIVDVYTATPAPVDIPGVRTVAPISDAPYQPNLYDDVITFIGDPASSDDGLDRLFQFGGAALLSRHQLIDHYLARQEPETVARMVSRQAGRMVTVGELLHLNRLKDALPDPMLDGIATAAHPLIVSGRSTPGFLPPSLRDGPDTDLRFVPPLPHCSIPPECLAEEKRMEARSRLGMDPAGIELVSFGAVDESRGADCCIWALQSLRAWNIPARLTFVGPDGPLIPPLQGLLARLGLENHCRFTAGWPDDATHADYLCAADAAIQLQSYDFGLASEGLLDCIAAGLPVVTNKAQAAAADAPYYCLTVPDHLSPLLVAETVLTLLDRGLHHAERDSDERRGYLARHSLDSAGRAVLEALGYATVTL